MIEVRRSAIRVSAERKVCCEKPNDMGGSDEYVEGWKRWLLRTSCGVAAHCKLRNHRGLVEVFEFETEIGEIRDGFVGFCLSFVFCLGAINGWSDEVSLRSI